VTGRFSSSNPNLQNLLSRQEEMASDIRGLYLPEEEDSWGAVDFASQEPRLAVHFASRAGVSGVRPFLEAYRENPNLDFHQKGAEITSLKRKTAKNLTLGKMYGMGGAKMCHSLGLPTIWVEKRNGEKVEVAGPEGQAIMDQYDLYMPFIKGLSEMCVRKAEARGVIRTLLGRKRHFTSQERAPGDDRRGAFPYKALNCLIQGSAADMTKKAMVDLHKQGARLLVTVHDEVGLSCRSKEQALRYKEIMVSCVQLDVPVTADLEYGPNWGHLELLQ
jgi:DNA polymerase I-like protein with 3'-5' exonuclease and polymerase domains